jgi:hypothetical protein
MLTLLDTPTDTPVCDLLPALRPQTRIVAGQCFGSQRPISDAACSLLQRAQSKQAESLE